MNNEMRPLGEVVQAVLAQIPDDDPMKPELETDIENIVTKARYTAPEVMSGRWGDLGVVLSRHLGEPDTDWKRLVAQIMMAKVDYTLYLPKST